MAMRSAGQVRTWTQEARALLSVLLPWGGQFISGVSVSPSVICPAHLKGTGGQSDRRKDIEHALERRLKSYRNGRHNCLFS